MEDVLVEKPERRRADRRQRTDRRFLCRGVDRRRADRRCAPVATAGFVIAACLAGARPAHAQIYSWRDANGTLVLSDRRLDPEARRIDTPSVREAPAIPQTRVASPVRAIRTLIAHERRASPYDGVIAEHAAKHGVRPDLVRAVIQAESGFNPRARSAKGAMGLMQLMPGTAADLGVLNPFNASENIRGGVAYLRQLLNRYDNNEALALAAYNAGPAAVDRHGSKVPPYQETQQYVKRILGWSPSAVAQAPAPPPAPKVIYKTIEVVDGLAVPRYSTTRPESGVYETLTLG